MLLFTCTTTRALHLEITQGVSANTLILALHRFMARRGIGRLFLVTISYSLMLILFTLIRVKNINMCEYSLKMLDMLEYA